MQSVRLCVLFFVVLVVIQGINSHWVGGPGYGRRFGYGPGLGYSRGFGVGGFAVGGFGGFYRPPPPPLIYAYPYPYWG